MNIASELSVVWVEFGAVGKMHVVIVYEGTSSLWCKS